MISQAHSGPFACSVCGECKPAESFGWYDKANGKRRRQCKPCHLAKSNEWKAANPEKVKSHKRAEYARNRESYLAYNNSDKRRRRLFDWKLENQFGITQAQYWAMYDKQTGLCAICDKPPDVFRGKPRRLYVDHDHKTGLVRGLLCYQCNVGLGCFNDNVRSLRRAVQYLNNAKEASHGPKKT